MKSQDLLVRVHVNCEHENVCVQGCMCESRLASSCVGVSFGDTRT